MVVEEDPSDERVGDEASELRPKPVRAAERFSFGVPARLEYRDAVRSFLTHICDQLVAREVLSERDSHGVVSAFVEAFNNAVIHAYDGHAFGPIEVAMSVDPRVLQVEVRDAGQTFVPEDVPEPDLDALPEGGLGLFIIRNFMDHVRYEKRGLQNVLMMQKRLDGATADSSDDLGSNDSPTER